ncbi:MAG: septal ring lytic transglycosylase RlpA family protein [Deltaproteobacteria bacterium]|nr:septal ring lytic transglycosylase RlpA family protein [Deltaproteobacteria bacterium]MBW2218160.1 septal ring lytic transglycosylase RlpA family protein [Deltaproteobacteria bacterium]
MKNPIRERFIPTVVIPFFAVFLFFLTCGCSSKLPPSSPPGHPKPYKIGKEWYQPIPSAHDFRQTGIASWYGKKFHGRKTANGEIYDMYAMTAAHKTLPLGTWVRVYNKKNGKEAVLRVNDRGPFIQGRIIDLSYTAAKKLEVVAEGTAPVEVVALGEASEKKSRPGTPVTYKPTNFYTGNFTFQVGAFKDRNNAIRLKQKLDEVYQNAHITTWNNGDDTFYRVRVGKYASLKKIAKDENILIQNGFKDVIIVAE